MTAGTMDKAATYPTIPKPAKISEFEMQADLYFRLKGLGYDVRGEVIANDQEKSRFDLVVFSMGQASIIIEVKNSACKAIIHGKKTRQVKKYQSFGLPIIFYTTHTPIEEVLAKVHKIMRY